VVTVSDHAPAPAAAAAGTAAHGNGGPGHAPAQDPGALDAGSAIAAGFGLAVISGLADDVRVLSTSSGVSVRMSWPSTGERP
jgi:hypothetical protein